MAVMDGVMVFLMGLWTALAASWLWFTSLFSSEAFSNVFSALLGAVIGSISGYWFNQRLEKTRTNERYQIQRKNVIYSPIYKKLLAFEDYLTERESKGLLSIDVEFKENKYSYYGGSKFRFYIWDEINQDIRKNYLLDTQQVAMAELIEEINKHEQLLVSTQKDINGIVANFIAKHSGSLEQSAAKYQVFSSDAPRLLAGFVGIDEYSRNASNDPVETLKELIAKEYNLTPQLIGKESKRLIEMLEAEPTVLALKPSFDNIKKLSTAAKEVFENKIRDTIKRYEGGL